ncbi:MAG: hypothetical protein LH474_13180 [Chamaesiphon sp.]|nr:hypothetical protein [Chamaesiphon sp.]
MNFESHDLSKVIKAIIVNRDQIQWKAGKAEAHLAKRIRLGHLAENATLADYETIINRVTNDRQARVYVYIYDQILYPTLTTIVEDRLWLVMMGIDGVMETAFPPDNPDKYLNKTAFVYLRILEELLP